jgi:hypothetical protein
MALDITIDLAQATESLRTAEEEGLPVSVTPLRPIERVVAQLREREAAVPIRVVHAMPAA